MRRRARLMAVATLFTAAITGLPALGGGHTWRVNEIFSNADGTIQFVELRESQGTNLERATGGHVVSSIATAKTFTITSNVTGPTANKCLLIATAAFAALPGAPTPDYTIPAGSLPFFFSIAGDTIRYSTYDESPGFVFSAGQLPTDGVSSLNRVCTFPDCPTVPTVGTNSPRNYAGVTGSVDASAPPPAVPDGQAGSTPMRASRLDVAGTSLSVTFDTATCTGVSSRQILYGQQSQLPTTPGGAFGLTGSACGVTASPFTWNGVPAPTGGTGLVWWLLAVKSATKEGSWGKTSAGAERIGPGPGGSSGQCGVTSRNIINACGH